MALTRAALRELGVTDKEVIDSIMEAHGETVEAAKGKAKDAAEAAMQKTIAELQAKVDAIPEADPDASDWKAKYEAEVAAHKDTIKTKDKTFSEYEATVKAAEANAVKQAKLRKQLVADGANPELLDLIEGKFDLSKIELVDDKIKGWEELSKPVKEQYASVFGTAHTEGAGVAKAPPSEASKAQAHKDMNAFIRGKIE